MDQSNFLAGLGLRIKTCRKGIPLSQSELAVRCNLEKSNLSRLEAGKANPTIVTIRKLSLAMNIGLSGLLDGL